MPEVVQPIVRPMDVNVWDLVCQVIESKRNRLDVVREQLSNMCAVEVGATKAQVCITNDPHYGLSMVFMDDGVGMDYVGHMDPPGRLDKFLAIAYSGHAGVPTDEFGQKGIGAKLSMDCKRLEIRTKSRETGKSYFVFVDDPLETLKRNEQPKFMVYPDAGLTSPGTEVRILGYAGGNTEKTYDRDAVRRYLYFSTIVGHTSPRRMPEIILDVFGNKEVITTGFPYITAPDTTDWKTYVLPEPIRRSREIKGKRIEVVLKGGFTLETGSPEITGLYTLTSRSNAGLFLSIRGIPYVWLDLNQFRGNFSTLQYKFCRFVVECDALFDSMDFARLSYGTGDVARIFEELLKACFNDLASKTEWKRFLRLREESEQLRKSESLDERKKRLLTPTQKFVYHKDFKRRLHRLPENEHDTLAVLWKMEAAGCIPLPRFETLEHTPLEGIDVLSNFRLRPDGDTKVLETAEVEDTFEEFIDHGHNPNQTGMIICWTIDDPEAPEVEQSDLPYLMYYKTSDRKIPILILKRMNTIEVLTSEEAVKAGYPR